MIQFAHPRKKISKNCLNTPIDLLINFSFSNLFGAPPMAAIGPAGSGGNQTLNRSSSSLSPIVSYQTSSSATDQGQIVGQSATGELANSSLIKAVAGSGTTNPGSSIRTTNQRLSSNSDLIVLMDSDLNIDRQNVNNRMMNSEMMMSGYIHAYGWSLPASSVQKSLASGSNDVNTSAAFLVDPSQASDNISLAQSKAGSLTGLQVPIPQYCRPLTGDSLGMKIWCATAIDLSGGYVPEEQQSALKSADVSSFGEINSSSSLVNISSSTPIKSPAGSSSHQNSLKQLEREVDHALNESAMEGSTSRPILKTTTEMVLSSLTKADDLEELSSCVWICSTQHSRSKITIIDINTKPNELLDSFYIPTFLYCIKSIPGSKLSDLPGILKLEQSQIVNQAHSEASKQKGFSTLQLINDLIDNQKREFYKLIEVDLEAVNKLRQSQLEAAAKRKKKQVTIDEQLNQTIEPAVAATDDQDEADNAAGSTQDKSSVSEDDAEISRILDNNVSVGIATLQKLHDFVAHNQPESLPDQSASTLSNNQQQTPTKLAAQKSTNGDNQEEQQSSGGHKDVIYYQPISTSLSTVWMGGKDSILYIHSAIGQWKDCVACVKLSDSILQICHFRGRVFVALADGSLCVFFRNFESKQWEYSQYLSIDINLMAEVSSDTLDLSTRPMTVHVTQKCDDDEDRPQGTSLLDETRDVLAAAASSTESTPTKQRSSNVSMSSESKRITKVAGIRCLEIANKNLWVGYRNRVLIIDPVTLKLKHSFNVVPQVDNQIRQLISMKDGVFICLRSDLILRLYSSIKPYQHIQNIDIEPIVTRLISPKTFVISHITAMKVADDNTLWIGNAHGIILTIPCKLVPQISDAPMIGPNGEYMEETPSSLSIARFVPKCDITDAQVSCRAQS